MDLTTSQQGIPAADGRTGGPAHGGRRGPILVSVLLVGTCFFIGLLSLQMLRTGRQSRFGIYYADVNLSFYGNATNEEELRVFELRCGEAQYLPALEENSIQLSMRTDAWGQVDINRLDTVKLHAMGFRIPYDGGGDPEYWEYETDPAYGTFFTCWTRNGQVTGMRCEIRTRPDEMHGRFIAAKPDVVFSTGGESPREFSLPLQSAELQRMFGRPTKLEKWE